jgi:hypothetical protein
MKQIPAVLYRNLGWLSSLVVLRYVAMEVLGVEESCCMCQRVAIIVGHPSSAAAHTHAIAFIIYRMSTRTTAALASFMDAD